MLVVRFAADSGPREQSHEPDRSDNNTPSQRITSCDDTTPPVRRHEHILLTTHRSGLPPLDERHIYIDHSLERSRSNSRHNRSQ
jgi:hypothetical protein